MQRTTFPRRIMPFAIRRQIPRRSATLSTCPVVVKADGLAAGKGVVICKSKTRPASRGRDAQRQDAGRGRRASGAGRMPERRGTFFSRAERRRTCGAAGWRRRTTSEWARATLARILAAWALTRTEPWSTSKCKTGCIQHVARPVVDGMKAEGAEYKGVLYCGLMMTARGPMVLEFNCRFGDPETQPILMRLESDLVEALEASIEGRVSDGDFRWSPDASVCVVMASGGYPGAFEAGQTHHRTRRRGKSRGRESLSRRHDEARCRSLPQAGACSASLPGRPACRRQWTALMRRWGKSALGARTIVKTLLHGR